jgi:putative oxidoreductase
MRRWIGLAARVALGLVFIAAAVTKLPDLRTFAEEVANYQLLPAMLVPLAAVAFVGAELVLGASLLAGIWVRASAVLAGAMLVVFIVALSQALVRGIDLRCGCFGGADVATWGTVARDVGLLVVAAVAVRFGEPAPADETGPAGADARGAD